MALLATKFNLELACIGELVQYFALEMIIKVTFFQNFINLLFVASTKPNVPLIITSPAGVAK